MDSHLASRSTANLTATCTLPVVVETFLGGLDNAAADKIRQSAVVRTYPARSYIFHEGDQGNAVLLVEAGLLRIDRTTTSGRVALLDLAIRGSLIGEMSVIDEAPRSATLSTVTESLVRVIPAAVFTGLLASEPAIQQALIAQLSRRLRALSTQFLETATMNAPARIAASLVRLVEIEQALGQLDEGQLSGAIDLQLPINQQELGQWSGLAREGAVKGFTALRTAGLIETGRKHVRIIDIKKLEQTARD